MALDHDKLILLLKVFLSKKILKEGINIIGFCEGVSSMHMQAVLAGPEQEKNFYARLSFLAKYASQKGNTFQKLEEEIDAIDETQKISEVPAAKLLKNNNLTPEERALLKKQADEQLKKARANRPPLREDQKALRDIKAFVESVFLHHKPDKAEIGVHSQQQKGIVSQLVAPVMWDKTGDYVHSSVLGIVSANKKDLTKYFSDIENSLRNNPNLSSEQRVSFLLTSDNHTIDVYFDPISKKWHFFDINNLEPNLLDKKYYAEISSSELANRVFTSFKDSDTTLFSIRRLSTQGYDLTLMENLIKEPEKGKIYLSENGDYIFADEKNIVHKGNLGKAMNFDNIKEKLYDFDFKANLIDQLAALPQKPLIKPVDKLDRNIHLSSTELLLKQERKHIALTNKSKLLGYEKTNARGWNALMLAVMQGQLSTVQNILRSYEMQKVPNKKILNQQEPKNGQTALMIAASYGHAEIAKALIKAGADLVKTDTQNRSIFEYGAGNSEVRKVIHSFRSTESTDALKALSILKQIKNVTKKNDALKKALETWPKFLDACDDKTLNKLIKLPGIDLTGKFGAQQETLLMIAAKNAHIKSINTLLKKESDVNATNHEGQTALMLASEKGKFSVVEALLTSPTIDVTHLDSMGNTALTLTVDGEIIKALIKKQPDMDLQNALLTAALNGRREAVNALINAGASVSLDDGTTMMKVINGFITALERSYDHQIETLIKIGADPDMILPTGETPLVFAAKKGDEETTKMLLVSGATVDLEDDDGHTALRVAAQKGHEEIVEYLLFQGANPLLENKAGQTALMMSQNSATQKMLHEAERNYAANTVTLHVDSSGPSQLSPHSSSPPQQSLTSQPLRTSVALHKHHSSSAGNLLSKAQTHKNNPDETLKTVKKSTVTMHYHTRSSSTGKLLSKSNKKTPSTLPPHKKPISKPPT